MADEAMKTEVTEVPERDLSTDYQYHLTSLGNSERFILRHGPNVRYCAEGETWLYWNGKRWAYDTAGKMKQRAKDTIKAMFDSLKDMDSGEERDKVYKWIKRSETNGQLEEMLKLAATDPNLVVQPSELDAQPNLQCVGNGVVDLRSGELLTPKREWLLTRHTTTEYDPEARCPEWEAFLESATDGNKELVGFLQRAVGYSIQGSTKEEVIFVGHGPGGTGKSTFIEAVSRAIGDYQMTANFSTFLKKDRVSGGPTEEIARLNGARMVCSIEVDDGQKLAEGLVKQMTGGDVVAARFLYKGTLEYRPQMKLWLICNHVPHIQSDDDAMWRRLVRVPFVHKPAKPNLSLKATLTSKPARRAVLAWAVRGAVEWYRHGLQIPESVRLSTASLRDDMNPLKQFLDDCCVFEDGSLTSVQAMTGAYETWCKANGQRFPLSSQNFNRNMQALGVQQPKSPEYIQGRRTRCWKGIRLGLAESQIVRRVVVADSSPRLPQTPGIFFEEEVN